MVHGGRDTGTLWNDAFRNIQSCVEREYSEEENRLRGKILKMAFDKAKGVAVDKPDSYTMQEAMAKYSMTRDQLYHYIKTYGISKVKVGRIIKISKQELDNLFAPPQI